MFSLYGWAHLQKHFNSKQYSNYGNVHLFCLNRFSLPMSKVNMVCYTFNYMYMYIVLHKFVTHDLEE